jgi:predicted nucleic acid-binding protein
MKRSRKTANKEVAFYETFFAAVSVWVDSIDSIKPAYTLACQHGLGALDALHVAAADRAGAEMLSAEKPTKPIYRAYALASSI